MILRTQDESDGRQFQLEITSKGRELIIEDGRRKAQWLAEAMDNRLSMIEMDMLRVSIQILDKLADAPSVEQTDGATQQV